MAVFKMSAAFNALGLSTPIVQAPMAGVQGSSLAIAVSNAGALGSLPCAMLTIDSIQSELQQIQQQTSNAVNVNFFCHAAPLQNQARQQRWFDALQHYFNEFGITPSQEPAAVARVPFDHDVADAIEPFKPAVVSFHFGLPNAELVQRIKAWGGMVLSTATTVKEAVWLERKGADAIIAQGYEAGGHRGVFLETPDADAHYLLTQTGTMALLPQVLDAVNVPVIAAGGISTAEGINAALSMGAAAVQMGTCFLLCDEVTISSLHTQAVKSVAGGERFTALTNVFSGRPARSVINRLMLEQGPISQDTPEFPTAAFAVAQLKAAAELKNSSDFSSLWCGQNPSGCNAIDAATHVKNLQAQLEGL